MGSCTTPGAAARPLVSVAWLMVEPWGTAVERRRGCSVLLGGSWESSFLIFASSAAISAFNARARSDIGSTFFLNNAITIFGSVSQEKHCQQSHQSNQRHRCQRPR